MSQDYEKSGNEVCPYFTWPELQSKGTFLRGKSPLLVDSTTQDGPNAHLGPGFSLWFSGFPTDAQLGCQHPAQIKGAEFISGVGLAQIHGFRLVLG